MPLVLHDRSASIISSLGLIQKFRTTHAFPFLLELGDVIVRKSAGEAPAHVGGRALLGGASRLIPSKGAAVVLDPNRQITRLTRDRALPCAA